MGPRGFWALLGLLGLSWPLLASLGALLGLSWGSLGAFLALLASLWGSFGLSWDSLGGLGSLALLNFVVYTRLACRTLRLAGDRWLQ